MILRRNLSFVRDQYRIVSDAGLSEQRITELDDWFITGRCRVPPAIGRAVQATEKGKFICRAITAVHLFNNDGDPRLA